MKDRGLDRSGLVAALVVAAALGVPMLVLQRFVAETRDAAIALVAIWIGIVGIGLLVLIRRRPRLRLPVAATWLAVVLGTLAVGYWTGFRDVTVMEDVAMAADQATGERRDRSLGGGATGGGAVPIELASGQFEGADGHAGSGTATVIEQPGGKRVLTFTEFDVDPGVDVEVFLTEDSDSVDDRVELGGLKGNVGDQQYEVPADADLRRFDNVILWCTPFTVRIAVAPLDA